MPDAVKDLEFLLAIVKTGTLAVNYDEAAPLLGLNKKQISKKMCNFRKDYNWPIKKDAAKSTTATAKPKTAKRVAAGDEEMKPAKRAKASKKSAKTEDTAEETPSEQAMPEED
ncbi:hypothetical protein EG329_002781 [Mollisiaceae sp. DMI_Dod_QoI]|nr:hypothetical protein EG329_002781 [Helotiales sp. DMI_Dod_QoI]